MMINKLKTNIKYQFSKFKSGVFNLFSFGTWDLEFKNV